MDGRRFDALATTLTEHRSRRGFARLLAGGALGAVAAVTTREASDAKAKSAGKAPKQGAVDTATKPREATAAMERAAARLSASAKRNRRCRYSQTICSHNGQCCPTTSGFICAWNGNNEGATVCCGVNGARCLGDYDCCNQAICLFGVCVG